MVHRTTLSSKRNPLTRSFLVLSFLAIGGLVAACGAYPTPGMAAGAAYKTADDKKPNLESVTFSLAADELDRKKALRARFGQFWGTGKGDPRSVYDTFVSSAGPITDGVTSERIETPPVQGWWLRPSAAERDGVIV
jgi:hypothetical protein